MDATAQTIDRDNKGRFRPGCSGNPAGKKPGTRNRATILREALRDGEDTSVARVVIDKAIAGDAVAARFVLERLEPKPRGRPIHLDIPKGESPAGEVVATFNAALRAMAAGEITPDEAVSVARFLEGRMRVLKAWQLEQKLTRWDNPLPIPGDDRPSPIPYPPPKEGWPDVLERVRLWGAPWPPPAAPSSSSSSPLGERIEVRGSRRAPVPPRNDAQAETPPLPNLSPRGEVMTAPAKLDDVSLSLRNLLPLAGEGGTSVDGVEEGAPPLFSPHLRRLIEAGMADPADNRWLAVLDEEWGLNGRLALHLPCKSGAPAAPPSAPAPAQDAGFGAGARAPA
jgi:hypothetical protein